nr:hypothetical protein [Candidatus Sigynarchaeota archaeon]MDO8109945.1 hypothetical protein [Candidatus Sigynarchaeota archaeon]MDO8110240.1 hypothetical protein [Candidatus Sigynarchaeota archaeon]MDO8113788.1 hypothetical protein [Candidatus Sigynarchaeota archaeon]
MTCRRFDAFVATRDFPARAGAHGSPPFVAIDVRVLRSKHQVIAPSMWRTTTRDYINHEAPRNF